MKKRFSFPCFVLLDKRLHRIVPVDKELSSDTAKYSLQFSGSDDMMIFRNNTTGKEYRKKLTTLSRPPCSDISIPNPVNPTYHVFTNFDSAGFRILTFSEYVQGNRIKIRLMKTRNSVKIGTRKFNDNTVIEITTDDGTWNVDTGETKIPPATGKRFKRKN